MNLLESNFFHITCPNCGANMKIDHGSLFKCPYCGTELHVFAGQQVEAVGFNFQISQMDKEMMEKNPDFKEYFNKAKDMRAAEALGDFLLKNGYVHISELPSPVVYGATEVRYMLKVVKPVEESK